MTPDTTRERAIDARYPDAIWILNSAAMLRPLRHEPRYQALLDAAFGRDMRLDPLRVHHGTP